MTRSAVRFLYLASLAVLVAACGGGGTTILNNASGVNSIELNLTSPSVAKGTSSQLSATGFSGNGHADVSADLTWSSSDPSVATVSSSGKITAVGTGTAIITGTCAVASACGSASASITVTVTAASLLSIALTPPSPSIAPGTTQQLTATGTFSDNSTQNLSADLTWTSSNPAAATVSSSGLVSTVGTGSATITATCKVASVCGVLAATTLVTVTNATLVSIALTPPAPSIAPGTSDQLTATGTFSDNSTQNLSADLTWTSSNPDAATVSSSGLVSTVGTGSTTITATCKVVSICGSLAGTTIVTVTTATLVSIAITPPIASVALNGSETFTATGTYSDNSTQNLTAQVTWTSATPAVATISNAVGTAGVAHPIATGTTRITAALGSVTSPAVTLTVTAATLVSIAVTPPGTSTALGVDKSFTATGTYSDNSTQSLTTQVTWGSATPAVATISNAVGTAGVAHPLTTGTTQITAALGSVTSSAVTLTVTAATLVSIAVTPPGTSTALGVDKSFTATGTYSDNSTQSLTTQVTWVSATPAVATISNAVGTAGVAHPLTTGTTQITAALGSVTSPAVTLTVTAATLVSIAVTPTGQSIAVAATEQFIATGTYTDNSTQVLTTTVNWASSDSSVASISNANNSHGLATALLAGSSSISATLGAIPSPSVTLTVTAASPAESVLWSFGSGSDGAKPFDKMIQATDGNFYGTTSQGGANSAGIVFKITPAGVETVLYSFAGGSDGTYPIAGVIQATDGNFYGTTSAGGTNGGDGTVFKITPAGVETVLYSFAAGGSDGNYPAAGLVQATDGNFYGTTSAGGANNTGTVFKITPAGVETVLYSFTGGSDASDPQAALIQATDGNFYGTTLTGGGDGDGAVFKITPAGVESVLYSFGNFATDGNGSYAALVQAADGNFYGTTINGGSGNVGTVFKLTPGGVETVLWSFGLVAGDGASPDAGLIVGADGNFYGTTYIGGSQADGTIFKLTPAGVETVLYSFAGDPSDGRKPYGGLVQGTDGRLYGTTEFGGPNDSGGPAAQAGTVFKY